MKSPSPKCYPTFKDMTIIQRHPPLIRYFTKSWPCYQTWPYYRFWRYYLIPGVSIEHLQRVWLASDAYSSGHLVLSHLGLAFVLMLRPLISVVVMSTDLLSFEHPLELYSLVTTTLKVWLSKVWLLDRHTQHRQIMCHIFINQLQWFTPEYLSSISI